MPRTGNEVCYYCKEVIGLEPGSGMVSLLGLDFHPGCDEKWDGELDENRGHDI